MQRLHRWLCTLLIAAGLALAPAAARAQEEAPTEDPVALAALLIADGNYDRARTVLLDIDPTARGVDLVRYWTLRGLLDLDAGDAPSAVTALEQARKAAGELPDPLLMITLARARVLAGDPDGAIETLDQGGAELDALASTWTLRARAHRDRGDLAGAWAAMQGGLERFPDQKALRRQQILLLIEQGLTRQAGELAHTLLQRDDTTEEDILVIAEALRLAGIHDQAIELLEAALLAEPTSLDVRVRLAVVYLGAGRPFAAARLFETAAALDPTYYHNAAMLYLAADRPGLALQANAQVVDNTTKVKQRFTILAQTGAWEQAAALGPRLARLNALEDEDLRYGLAYAHFETGAWTKAEQLLLGIEDARLFRQATALRQAIEKCRDAPEQCG